MAGRCVVVYDDSLMRYDFGPSHPMAPVRLQLTIALARALGVLDAAEVTVVPSRGATDEELRLVHEPAYIASVKRLSEGIGETDLPRGLGTEDDPVFPGMHDATARIVGATLEAARSVWSGEALHAVNISGGLHHAMAGAASGFCVYNDPAIAIRWLLAAGAAKVAYVDVDAHHGDGVQAAFYADPRVLTISLHESPRSLFPGTGHPQESGASGAEGMAVNVPLPPGTSDAGWLRAFHAVVPTLLREFAPDIIVSQHGCDSHALDPLTHLELSVEGQRTPQVELHALAHELCGGRWLATGGGGYAVLDVVPRTWTHLLAIAAGRPIDPRTPVPAQWRADVAARTGGHQTPAEMGDGRDAAYDDWSEGYDPASWLDRLVVQVRRETFPHHGLHIDE